jgi:hypothetical protein
MQKISFIKTTQLCRQQALVIYLKFVFVFFSTLRNSIKPLCTIGGKVAKAGLLLSRVEHNRVHAKTAAAHDILRPGNLLTDQRF